MARALCQRSRVVLALLAELAHVERLAVLARGPRHRPQFDEMLTHILVVLVLVLIVAVDQLSAHGSRSDILRG